MHQQPPKMPLLRSTNAANAVHVDSSSALTVYVGSAMKSSLMRAVARASSSKSGMGSAQACDLVVGVPGRDREAGPGQGGGDRGPRPGGGVLVTRATGRPAVRGCRSAATAPAAAARTRSAPPSMSISTRCVACGDHNAKSAPRQPKTPGSATPGQRLDRPTAEPAPCGSAVGARRGWLWRPGAWRAAAGTSAAFAAMAGVAGRGWPPPACRVLRG